MMMVVMMMMVMSMLTLATSPPSAVLFLGLVPPAQLHGVFAAAADKAGHGGVELLIRQDIMGDPRSFHVLVAEPLVKGHTAAGVIQFCVCHGPDSTRDQAWWRRAAALIRSLCQVCLFTARRALQCQCAGGIGCVAGHWRSGGAALPGLHNDPAKPTGTWCSRTRWHRTDFVAVPRDWFAGVTDGGVLGERGF